MKKVLGKTLGVPLFQEQAMRIAIVAAKFEPGEADRLRRAMATFRRVGTIGLFKAKMIEGMVTRGYERSFAERCFSQIEGFGEYGFPESHAASFALLVYASAWIKCRYPDVFCAAMLNAQPMGFYAPAQLVRDAREHGVELREVDINFSEWGSHAGGGTLASELPSPLRGGVGSGVSPPRLRSTPLTQPSPARGEGRALFTPATWNKPPPSAPRTPSVSGFARSRAFARPTPSTSSPRAQQPFTSVRDLWLRSGISRAGLERLAEADAFRSIGLDRRAALWEVRALDPLSAAERLPLFAAAGDGGCAPAARGAGGAPPDAAGRARGERLPLAVAFAEGASRLVPAPRACRAPHRGDGTACRDARPAGASPSPASSLSASAPAPHRA